MPTALSASLCFIDSGAEKMGFYHKHKSFWIEVGICLELRIWEEPILLERFSNFRQMLPGTGLSNSYTRSTRAWTVRDLEGSQWMAREIYLSRRQKRA